MEDKICSKCKQLKSSDRFSLAGSRSKSNPNRRRTDCKDCERDKSYANIAIRKQKNPEEWENARRNSVLKNKYGITLFDFEQMIADQDNKCFICNKEFGDQKSVNKPSVDHCHTSQNVRKLLCGRCNTALGMLMEDELICSNMLSYIQTYKKD